MKRSHLIISCLCALIHASLMFAASFPNGITITRDGAGYLVSFDLPVYQKAQVTANGQDYINLSVPDYGVTSEVGLPALPIISFGLMIAPEENAVETAVIQQTTEGEVLSFKIFPAQEPWPKSRPLSERPFRINREFYASRGKSDQPFISVSEPFIIAGAKGVTITLSPFTYSPARNRLDAVRRASFRITLRGTPRAEGRFTKSLHSLLSKVFVNFDASLTLGSGNYLIIAAPEYESALSSFVNFKQSHGYPVFTANTTVAGNTTSAIKNFIQQRYNNVATRPEFILLVGDVDRIPEWVGSTTDNPHTDLFYVHLDGTDYYPDASIGRLAISNLTELQNIITKTIFMENAINELPKKNVFMSSTDNWAITEGTHNAVIDTFFQPNGYANLKRYTHTYNATTAQVVGDLNSNQTFAIYSGHGSVTGWADGPPFTQSNIRSLTNTVYPYVYSFSCLTGQYQAPECFGETWIRIPTGGSAYWGSSVTSYWDEDDILEKRLFRAMFPDSLIQSGPMFHMAKFYLASHYGGFTGTVKRYFEMYNLLGDPSLYCAPYTPVNVGWVEGTITHNGSPLPGATVDFIGLSFPRPVQSRADGKYAIWAPADSGSTAASYTLRARKFGYAEDTCSVAVRWHDTTTVNMPMTALAQGTLSVRAFCSDSAAMRAAVQVLYAGNVVLTSVTDSITGRLSASLPGGIYSVVIDPPSPYGTRTFSNVMINTGQTTPVNALLRCVIEHSPLTLRDTLQQGTVHSKTLVLVNTTTDSIRYRITDELALRMAGMAKVAVQPRTTPIRHIERPKGAEDTEHSSSAKGGGGPDAFGYRWIDSDSSGGPAFNWFNIDSIGTPITSWSGTRDDGYYTTSLPWAFPFYGNDYSTVNIGTNGFLNFGTTSTEYSNGTIPSADEPNNAIYAFWDDLNLTSRGRVTYYADMLNSRFIVQYTNVPRYSGTSDSLTFQIILEPNGEIRYQFLRMASSTLNSATIGIENADGTVALQVVSSASYVHNNLAVKLYLPDAPWLSENPRLGVLPPASSVNITVTFDANSLSPNSVNTADIHLTVNHPDVAEDILVPAVLNVRPVTGIEETSPAIPTQFSLDQNYPNPFNPTTTIRYSIPVGTYGHTSLQVYDVLGREMATLVNEVKSPGRHVVQWNASGVASGVYYCRMTAGAFTETRKLLLLR